METAPLKSFATASRTELIREVGARITAVLAQGSPERVEQPNAVAALERAISGAGGGDKGKKHVADKVAYTWFNRLIALRFMDANGYTDIGVVSPATDQVGQPEVLAAAKRGQLDASVVKGANAATIAGLLNGTRMPRPGVDAQAEAYALLLADYCRFWHGAMPFMFEREGDYTELLIPANLLAQESVLSRSVSVLTEDVCRDVEVIGWLYQFYIAERKDEVFAGFKKNRKAGADEIPAATQLFTPHWIVRYLVENSLGRLWMLNHPESRLVDQMDYYIAPVDEETDFLRISKPEELKVIDPACGSGHMLTYAFDLLYAIYEEEGYAPSETPGLILRNNLYGTEIDPRAGALAAFALTMKAASKRKLFLKNPVEPNVCVLDPISFSADELAYLVTKDGDRYAEEAFWNQFADADTFGSLIKPDPTLVARLARHLATLDDGGDMYLADAIEWAQRALDQAEYLLPRYSVVVANPPYMGSANMNSSLRSWADRSEPAGKADLFSLFILRCIALSRNGGLVSMVTMQSWMFLKGFADLREKVLSGAPIRVLAHFGARAFDSIPGERVKTVAFVLEPNGDTAQRGAFVRLVDGDDEAAKESGLRAAVADMDLRHSLTSAALRVVPESPIAYWATEEVVDLFHGPKFASRYTARIGIQSGDNARHYRRWPEVSRKTIRRDLASWAEFSNEGDGIWVPLEAGGDRRKWYGNTTQVARLGREGRSITATANGSLRNNTAYFKPGVVWNRLNEGRMGFRLVPTGHVFDDLSPFVQSNSDADLREALAILGSDLGRELLGIVGSGSKTEVGHANRLPFPTSGSSLVRSADVAGQLVELARTDWDLSEQSLDFLCPALLVGGSSGRLEERAREAITLIANRESQVSDLQMQLDGEIVNAFGVGIPVAPTDVTLLYGRQTTSKDLAVDLVSYAVGCMLGRYSLDEPGLVLADQGASLEDYLTRVPTPSFTPDADNVIPIVDGDWFEDDVVGLFRRFLRTAFGEQHFEENLKFVTESLGVRNLREYFVTRAGRSKFYDDHVQRYKKRPIYWLFSSPKGSFNALIYMHRYTPSTVSTVLTYLREYVTKLESAVQQAERAGNAKEADRLRKILVELKEYEHDTLYPKASENVAIDLDDGVKANYPKFGAALRRIPGLEAPGD